MPYCHKCGAEAADWAKYCIKCGAELVVTLDTTAARSSDVGTPAKLLTCGNCGREFGASLLNCPHCGRQAVAGIPCGDKAEPSAGSESEEAGVEDLPILEMADEEFEGEPAAVGAGPRLSVPDRSSPETAQGRTWRLGSNLSVCGALVVLFGFFLPWVRACGTEMSGWDLATNRHGNVEAAPLFFLTPVCAIVVFVLIVSERRRTRSGRAVPVVNSILSAIGSYSICTIVLNVVDNRPIDLLLGFWATLAGLMSMFVGSLMGSTSKRRDQPGEPPLEPERGMLPHTVKEPAQVNGIPPVGEMGLRTVRCPDCGVLNSTGASFCRECGLSLAEQSHKD
ncbi:MAG TPA: zinc ribbon domain-containing protein [Anaerolineae bacterium]|nr:zinc ribbon domain-containing protein [Anaerolineae bacterium]